MNRTPPRVIGSGSSVRSLVFSFLALAACTDLRFEDSASTSTTGAGGTGAGPTSGGGGAGAVGGVGGSSEEICNGLDDDGDGIADEPPTGEGPFCDCEWLTFEGALYAACPTPAVLDEVTCPAGMELVVLQSAAEQEALGKLIPPEASGYTGLRQEDGASNPRAKWSWVGRIGMPPAWGTNQPNDAGPFTEPVEGDRQQCGFLFRSSADVYSLADGACSGETLTLAVCEASRTPLCVPGAPCTLGSGCNGVFTCSEGEPVCAPVPASSTCNGLDDECDGEIGDDDCGCNVVFGPIGRQYKTCAKLARPADAECGEGFRLANPTTSEEFAFLESISFAPGTMGERWIGVFQIVGQATPDTGWITLDGTPVLPGAWESGEPGDADGVEDGTQDCGYMNVGGLRDGDCSTPRGALCEEVP